MATTEVVQVNQFVQIDVAAVGNVIKMIQEQNLKLDEIKNLIAEVGYRQVLIESVCAGWVIGCSLVCASAFVTACALRNVKKQNQANQPNEQNT